MGAAGFAALHAAAVTLQAAHAAVGRPPIEVGWGRVALSAALVLAAIAISAWQRLGLGRGLAIGAVRAVVQLAAVGYVLLYLFAVRRWYLVLLALLVMLLAATKTATDRQRRGGGTLFAISGAAMLIGAGLTLAYVGAVVVRVHPWYDPEYLIPLFGMIIGNAMNGAALAAERLAGEIESRRPEIEAWLALGASPARAAQGPERRALVAALIPTVNGLAVVGLVALPGMMTGQILAGASPVLAVRYQIVVAFMLAGAVATTAALVVRWYRRTFFTPAEQLVPRNAEPGEAAGSIA